MNATRAGISTRWPKNNGSDGRRSQSRASSINGLVGVGEARHVDGGQGKSHKPEKEGGRESEQAGEAQAKKPREREDGDGNLFEEID